MSFWSRGLARARGFATAFPSLLSVSSLVACGAERMGAPLDDETARCARTTVKRITLIVVVPIGLFFSPNGIKAESNSDSSPLFYTICPDEEAAYEQRNYLDSFKNNPPIPESANGKYSSVEKCASSLMTIRAIRKATIPDGLAWNVVYDEQGKFICEILRYNNPLLIRCGYQLQATYYYAEITLINGQHSMPIAQVLPTQSITQYLAARKRKP